MDKQLRREIADAVREALANVEERGGEVYLTAKDLSAKFGMFSPDWVKRNGWRLPRRRVDFTGEDGKPQHTQWGYPLHEIQRIVESGTL
jgi:hypothetical protein